jgi:hypothetical protein
VVTDHCESGIVQTRVYWRFDFDTGLPDMRFKP